MRQQHRMVRVAVLATGLGVGVAMASMPAVACADSINGADAASAAAYLPDFGAVAAASAQVTPPTLPTDFSNYAISVSGIPLYQSGTAFATSSFGNYAIAHGDHAGAYASTGLFNSATVDGDGSVAGVNGNGFGFFNSASVMGTLSSAQATMGSGGASYNVATVNGDYSLADAGRADPNAISGSYNTATATGAHALAYADTNGTSNNVANAFGDRSVAYSPVQIGAAAEPSGASTGTDLLADPAAAAAAVTPPTLPDDSSNYAISFSGVSLFDNGSASATSTFGGLAIAHGEFSSATAGLFNYASATGYSSVAEALSNNGAFNQAIAEGSNSQAMVVVGTGNVATATGDNSFASAGWAIPNGGLDTSAQWNFNTATATGLGAQANAGGALGDSSTVGSYNVATATGDNVYAVAPDASPGAAESGNWFTDLLSSFDGGSTAGESGNWLTELLASFDGASAAGDSANFWTELTTLF